MYQCLVQFVRHLAELLYHFAIFTIAHSYHKHYEYLYCYLVFCIFYFISFHQDIIALLYLKLELSNKAI